MKTYIVKLKIYTDKQKIENVHNLHSFTCGFDVVKTHKRIKKMLLCYFT